MRDLTEHDFADLIFLDLVDAPKLRGVALEALSKSNLPPSTFRSNLVERIEKAWIKPINLLTCHEVCCLLGQEMGLQWLGKPILNFVREYPAANCGYYPGDMLKRFLEVRGTIAELLPNELREFAKDDLDALEPIFAWSRPALREFRDAVADLRAWAS